MRSKPRHTTTRYRSTAPTSHRAAPSTPARPFSGLGAFALTTTKEPPP
ncbi:hypothetical protein [Streptomyces sp. OspMP-M43]|nr:hypothetical protein [Streptomyces sp. OspMP-M43]